MLSIEKQLLYLLTSGDGAGAGAAVSRLIQVYEARGISHQIVRNALSKLKKEGYAESAERSRYRATPLGEEFIRIVNAKPGLYEKEWDRQWCMVLFEIPESERRRRDSFRTELLQLGFGSLYKSVYVSPWDYREEVIRLGEQCDVSSYITVTNTSIVHNDITSEQSIHLWPIEELQEMYRRKESWFQEYLEPALARLEDTGSTEGLQLFVYFLELGDVIAELGLRDPMLPNELLPDNWTGKQLMQQFQASLRQIALAIPEQSPYRAFVAHFLGR
ncbi:PaaX family transcriptional regulator C-terminal domain-containing protein [Paenibacillus lupini]|uniref:PaaX family transcriptional regulator C-terminal domain-containing protein n=1 Tax=Paenibacillus lupini TaxID=1450204 RepID=UPI0014246B42|nr:PaaX family transcriptional regulator C-terminal domain-containing protein [Paenibacillus lupini]NIK23837.1 phenylacetic acid degradation operon negative regulatory protein [Paenibacillus lupini]